MITTEQTEIPVLKSPYFSVAEEDLPKEGTMFIYPSSDGKYFVALKTVLGREIFGVISKKYHAEIFARALLSEPKLIFEILRVQKEEWEKMTSICGRD